MKNLKKLVFLFIIISFAAFGPGLGFAAEGDKTGVEIQRTNFGVAHILASDYEGLGYGVAYAHAQDNVCQTADRLVTIRGERSKFFGAAAMGRLGLRLLPNEQIDFFIQAHMDDAALAQAQTKASESVRAMARGYVAGYNRFLTDNASTLPVACRGLSWIRPMTEADFQRLNEETMVQAGISALADAVVAARPPQSSADAGDSYGTPFAALTPEALRVINEGSHLGSNGWAFGREVTSNGRGLLLGNPHFPWEGQNRFWQMHLTIPGELDVMGARIGHGAVVQIGFNKDVAWTHTVSTGKRFTLHELTLDEKDPTTYIVDGQPRKMTSRKVVIEVLQPDGSIAKKEHTVWFSHYGPLLVLPGAGLNWDLKVAYAIQDANTLNTRSDDVWVAYAKAHSVAEMQQAMKKLGYMPWVNTIAADRNGRAMYADVSVVPDVSAEQLKRCAPSKPAAALFTMAGLPVLDGSKSECNWLRDSTSIEPGLIPFERLPILERSDWVQNSNDSYWLSNPAYQWRDISPMVGLKDAVFRPRTRSGLTEIRKAVKEGKLGLAEVEAVLFADRNFMAAMELDDLLVSCAEASTDDAKAGCAVLRGWNRTNTLDAPGAPLFREFWRRAKDIPDVWRIPFDPKDPVGTPSGLKMENEAVRARVFSALQEGVASLRKAGFKPEATLRTTQIIQTNRGPVAVPGGDEFEGVLNKVETQGQPTVNEKGYNVNFGSSYIQVVTFDDRGPVAEGLLTYGQSSDPASPYAYDQLPWFSRGQWIKQPFHPEDVQSQRVGEVLRLKIR
jgi:acyl-homoserine-lactone acylase